VSSEFSGDSSLLFTSAMDCAIKVWDVESGAQVFQLNVPYAPTGLHLHPVLTHTSASASPPASIHSKLHD
jgi:hypothetical protein